MGLYITQVISEGIHCKDCVLSLFNTLTVALSVYVVCVYVGYLRCTLAPFLWMWPAECGICFVETATVFSSEQLLVSTLSYKFTHHLIFPCAYCLSLSLSLSFSLSLLFPSLSLFQPCLYIYIHRCFEVVPERSNGETHN